MQRTCALLQAGCVGRAEVRATSSALERRPLPGRDDAGRTEDTADLALDVTDLASPYLGAFDFHSLARAGLVEERVEGALEAATLLFRTDFPPFCPEVF